MAYTYGTVTNCKVRNGQTRTEYECRLGYEVQSQSVANNTSSVKLKLECRSINSTYQTKGSSGLTSVIDGTTVKNNAAVDMSNTNTWQNFGERTITVTHNADGTYSASKSGSFTCTAGSSDYSLASGSASVTVAPAKIARYATANQSLNSKTTSSITMNWSSDSTIDYIWFSINNGSSWSGIDIADATGGTYTISGLSANTTYNIKTRVRRKDSQLTTDSSTLAVTTEQKTPVINSFTVTGRSSSSITCKFTCDSAQTFYYKLSTQSSWKQGSSGSITSGSFTISGLSANTTYTINLKCRNWINQSAQTFKDADKSLSQATHQTTVASISLSSKTSSSITVSSSCNVTASSTRYRIMKSGGSYGSWQTSATFSGLSANTTYTVQVEKVGQASGESGYATVNVTTHQKTIPTISLSSKTVNSITVSSGCNVTVSSTQYRIKTSSGSYGNYQTSATFSGLSPNTTYVIEVKKVGTSSGESGIATLNVTTYQIATISSASNFNLGSSEVVNYSNPSGSTIAIGIYLTDGATALAGYRTVSGSSYTFNFTDTELDTIYKKLGTNNSITVRIYLRTTCNSTNYYSTKDVTVTLTGNQKTAHIGVGGVQKRAKVFIGVNGSVKRAVMWIGNNGRKRCI